MVALTEAVVHGWDVAVATGQRIEVDDEVAEAVLTHLSSFTAAGPVEGLFGPAVESPSFAGTLERAIAISGRDPHWRPV